MPTPPVASGHASGGETASTSEEGRSSSGSATSAGATTASSSPSGAPGALGTTRLCVAVGTYQHAGEFRFGGRTVEGWDSPYALEWDGARWTLTLLPVGTNEPDVVVHGLACVRPAQEAGPRSRAGASSSCLAVGDSSLVQDLPTSRAWIRVQSPWQSVDTSGLDRSANSLGAVSCAPDGVCLATGWTVYRSTTSQPIAAGDDRASGIALAAATASRQAVVARYSILPPATSASGATTSNRSVLVSVLGAAVLLIAAGLIAYRRWRARGALRRVGG